MKCSEIQNIAAITILRTQLIFMWRKAYWLSLFGEYHLSSSWIPFSVTVRCKTRTVKLIALLEAPIGGLNAKLSQPCTHYEGSYDIFKFKPTIPILFLYTRFKICVNCKWKMFANLVVNSFFLRVFRFAYHCKLISLCYHASLIIY